MASPYEMFKTSKELEADKGVILDYGDFRVRIARAGGGNKKYARIITARLKPYRRQIDTDTMDEELARKIHAEVYADTVILGWESKGPDGKFVSGIQDENGDILPFSREAVIKTLLDLPDLFSDIQAQAGKVSLFRAAELEDDTKK
jgi:hypothetical protein